MTTLSNITDPVNNAVLRPVSDVLPSGLGARVPDSPRAAVRNLVSSAVTVGTLVVGGVMAIATGVGSVFGAGVLVVLASSLLGYTDAIVATGTNWVGIGVGSPP